VKSLRIYIASSWKNQHAVEMLTDRLRSDDHVVLSFVENNHGEGPNKPVPFEQWVISEKGKQSFDYDTKGATTADLVIYIGPSGCDAWAEVGAAWAAGRPIFGLWSKGEQVGLMRRMMEGWTEDYRQILHWVTLAAIEPQEVG
jgi:hypothetical protein